MKKLLLICIFTFVLACSAQIQPRRLTDDSRPYLHWQIEFVKFDGKETIKDSVLIETLELSDAIKQFQTQCPDCQIRAIFRHYYYSSCNQR